MFGCHANVCAQFREVLQLQFTSFFSCQSLSTSNGNQTLRYPTSFLETSSQARFASMLQNCFYFVALKQADILPLYDAVISFSCTASLLQHSLHRDLEYQFECHICKRKNIHAPRFIMSKMISDRNCSKAITQGMLSLNISASCSACSFSSVEDILLCPCRKNSKTSDSISKFLFSLFLWQTKMSSITLNL